MGRLGGYLKDKLGNIFLPYPCLPVGSIYLSVNDTNPSTYFGGKWEQWGKGKVLVGVDSEDTDFKTVEKTGGEKAHKLTVNEIPSHNHYTKFAQSAISVQPYSTGTPTWPLYLYSSAALQTEYTGGGQSHNNLQPYITCYMWKRVA